MQQNYNFPQKVLKHEATVMTDMLTTIISLLLLLPPLQFYYLKNE